MGTLLMTTTACAQSNDEAKNVLRLSREKCKSIQQGHYVMEHWKKFVSDKDTNLTIYTCDFRKVRRDRLFGKVFAMQDDNPGHPEWNRYTLYTGEEFVTYSDSTGEVMSCKQWRDKIKSIRHNYTFYEALTKRNSYPLPDEKELADSSYTYSISDTMLDNKPCLIDSLPTPPTPPDSVGIATIETTDFSLFPNPTTGKVTIQVQNSNFIIQHCYLTDLTGRREEVRLTLDGPNRYTLDLTSRPQDTYLLTLTTADGYQHTVKLIKQSDSFGK